MKKYLNEILNTLGKYGLNEVNALMISTLLNNRFEGMVAVDSAGRITYLSQTDEKFFKLKHGEAKLKNVKDVIPNTRLDVVCKTGIAEIGKIQEIGGRKKIVSRIPLFKDGKLTGAIGKIMFKRIDEVENLVKTIKLLEKEISYYKKELSELKTQKFTFSQLIGKSKPFTDAVNIAKKVAQSDSPVLLTGESGTGKELFAKAIHFESLRGAFPLIKVNCAAIPSELAESELFGYDEGAFSGAKRGGKKGRFELADGGTILLDEISELSPQVQSKLLRVLQEKEIERVGGTKAIPVNFRLIAATNQNLHTLVDAGKFRLDLYFRLSKIPIAIPPLRERKEDIPLYLNHFLYETNKVLGTNISGFSKNALNLLFSYSWKGNIRELINVVEQAVWKSSQSIIELEDIPEYIIKSVKIDDNYTGEINLKNYLTLIEKEKIAFVLKKHKGNKSLASRVLGIHRTGLYQKLKKYGLL